MMLTFSLSWTDLVTYPLSTHRQTACSGLPEQQLEMQDSLLCPKNTHFCMRLTVGVKDICKAISFFWVTENRLDLILLHSFPKITFPHSSEQLFKILLQNKVSPQTRGPLLHELPGLQLEPSPSPHLCDGPVNNLAPTVSY